MNNRLIQCLMGISLLWNTAHATSFNEAQKHDIERIIREYLINNPEILAQSIQALQAKENKAWLEQVKKVVAQRFDELFNSTSPAFKENKPAISIVEFFDYNCSHCKKFSKILTTSLSQNKDVQIIYKELPILNEGSLFAAKAALAAHQQNKYQDLHRKFMSYDEVLTYESVMKMAKEAGLDLKKLETDMNDPKIIEELRNNHKLAIELGIKGTPTIIIGKNPATKDMPIEVIPGDVTQQIFDEKLSNVRKQSTSKGTAS